MNHLRKQVPLEYLRELLNSKDDSALKSMLRSLLESSGDDFIEILNELFETSDEKVRDRLCSCLSELGLHLDLWSNKVDLLYHLISRNCKPIYLADFKVVLNHNVMMLKRVIDFEFYEKYGVDMVLLFETIINPNMQINGEFHKRLVNNVPKSLLKRIMDVVNHISNKYKLFRRDTVFIAELLINKLDIMGIASSIELSEYIVEKISKIEKKLDYTRSLILTFILMHLPTRNIDKLVKALLDHSTNVSSLLGIASGIILTIIHYLDPSVLINNLNHPSIVWIFLEKIMMRPGDDFIQIIDLVRKKLTNILLSKISLSLVRALLDREDNICVRDMLNIAYAVGVNSPADCIGVTRLLMNKKINQDTLYIVLRIRLILIINFFFDFS